MRSPKRACSSVPIVATIANRIKEIRSEHIPQPRIDRRKTFEEKARDILSKNLRRLTRDDLNDFLRYLDSDFRDGAVTARRFGPLLSPRNRSILYQSDLESVNELFAEIFASEPLHKVDELLEGWKGVSYGLVSCLLYLKDPNKYSIFLPKLSEGILVAYPDKRLAFHYDKPFEKNYLAFSEIVNQLRAEHSLLPQEVDIVLTVLSRDAEVHKEEEPTVSVVVDMDYIPPVLTHLDRLSANDDSLRSIYGKDPERVLEEKLWIAGRMLGFTVEELGQGKGAVPDAVYRAEFDRYAVLVDAKARADGYDMGTDYRAANDYLDRKGKELQKSGFRVYYAIVSHKFLGDSRESIRIVRKQHIARNVTFFTAEAILRLIEVKLKDPGLALDDMEDVFDEGGIITAEHVRHLLRPKP